MEVVFHSLATSLLRNGGGSSAQRVQAGKTDRREPQPHLAKESVAEERWPRASAAGQRAVRGELSQHFVFTRHTVKYRTGNGLPKPSSRSVSRRSEFETRGTTPK